MTSAATRSSRALTGTERARKMPAELVRRDHGLRCQVEGARGISGQGQPVGARHIPGVERLELEAVHPRHDRDEARAHQRTRQERPGEKAPDLRGSVAREDQPRPQTHDAHGRLLALEAIEQRFDRRLVPGVEGRLDAGDRPGLVYPPVLRSRCIRADGRGVNERSHAGIRHRRGTRARCLRRSHAGSGCGHDRAGSATPGARRRRRPERSARAARWPRRRHATRPSGTGASGTRRQTPTTDSTAGSSTSSRRTLVPTLPLAPYDDHSHARRLPGGRAPNHR